MPYSDQYKIQVALLLRIIPFIAEEKCFALKGGTAINLFVRNMPRLSVDIDLTYLPVEDRAVSLAKIHAAMERIASRIVATIAGAQITRATLEDITTKLVVQVGLTQVKIEVTPVLRGCVFDADLRSVVPLVEEHFGFAEISIVSFADLYAGKIVAALDRQHPRDLFDARDLLSHEGINDDLRRAFVVYLLSHGRPMFEILNARRKDVTQEFMQSFEGMTDAPVSLDDLLAARESLIQKIVGEMPNDHRKFLVSFEEGNADWSLIDIATAAHLPAVLWRQRNLDTLSIEKRKMLVDQLKQSLNQ